MLRQPVALDDAALPRPARSPRRAAGRSCSRARTARTADEPERRARARRAALLHADRGRGRQRARLSTRLHRDVRLHAEEMIGNSVLDQIHPDDQGRAVEGWLAVLSTRRDQQTRLRRRRKDGTWMWVDTTLHNFLNQPGPQLRARRDHRHLGGDGRPRKRSQEREELLRRLTDAMPVGLLQLDVERNVVYHNARLLEILYGSDRAAARRHRATRRRRSAGRQPSARREGCSHPDRGGPHAFDAALRGGARRGQSTATSRSTSCCPPAASGGR